MTNPLSWLDKLPRCASCGERLHAGRHLLIEHNEHECTRLFYEEKCNPGFAVHPGLSDEWTKTAQNFWRGIEVTNENQHQ